jgi:hypothetical protein
MVVSGKWTLHFDWNCDGSYSQVDITFDNNGNFSTSEGLTGKWVQVEGMILWQYANKCTYGGNVAGNAMTGLMSTFAGLKGCWYAIKAGATTKLVAERKPEFDTAGNKAKY